MSFDAGIENSALTVLLDVRHPFAYLALGPAAALGATRGLDVNWLPFSAAPLKAPSTPGPADDRSVLHKRHRAHMIAREIETYAAAQNLILRDYYRDPSADAVELGWLWIRGTQPARLLDFLSETFRRYWAAELDSSDLNAVARLVSDAGGDATQFESWVADEGPDRAHELRSDLLARGVGGVPAYLVENEYFLGRQHLEMIGWILDGRRGPGPI